MAWCSRLEETTGSPSLSPVQCRRQMTVRLLWGRRCCCLHGHPQGMLPFPRWVWWESQAAGPLTVAFCTYLFSSSLGPAHWGLSWSRDCGGGGQTHHAVSGRSSKGDLGVQCQMGCAHPRRALLMPCVTCFSIYKMTIPAKRAELRHWPSLRIAGISRRFRRNCYANI